MKKFILLLTLLASFVAAIPAQAGENDFFCGLAGGVPGALLGSTVGGGRGQKVAIAGGAVMGFQICKSMTAKPPAPVVQQVAVQQRAVYSQADYQQGGGYDEAVDPDIVAARKAGYAKRAQIEAYNNRAAKQQRIQYEYACAVNPANCSPQ